MKLRLGAIGLVTCCLLGTAATTTSAAAPPEPVVPLAEAVPCAVPDQQDAALPDRVHLTGLLGQRIAGNESARLAKLDPTRLLEGYRHRPGRQSWDGEHVGKWLHAATLAWVNTGDPALRQKLDTVAAELCRCQLPDGYLGTYAPQDRWTNWDVWAHKYNLLGLLTYIRYTGNRTPLSTCCRMGDLLCSTFGDTAGRRDIIPAGEHVGMAPTSVLEPMVLLYRLTGEQRYLEFCRYILRAWEQPNGPHIISRLLTTKRVDKVGNGKAYEMLSCLNGALEYYRTVGGERQILDACLNAWQDIVDKRLYLTGAASYGEHFHDDFDLPSTGNVGETCVTVTWLQFNAHLLRLTGEARFAEQLERVALNQLLGAQQPDCTAWGYYVQMEGKKPYSATLDGHCCLSSGPRGIALIPTFAYATDSAGVVLNLYDAGTARLILRNQTAVDLAVRTQYPADGTIHVTVNPAAPAAFTVKLRIPEWCREFSVRVNDQPVPAARGADGYVALARTWSPGDTLVLCLPLAARVVVGTHHQAGQIAVLYGPLVLAADEALLPDAHHSLAAIAAAGADAAALDVTPEPAPPGFQSWSGAQVFRIQAVTRNGGQPLTIRLLPFAQAGGTGSRYKVWLPLPGTGGGSLLAGGVESRSRPGNLPGTINGDSPAAVCTFDNKPAAQDWYAITLAAPVRIGRVQFLHGKSFHDGGWFAAAAAKPQVQVQRRAGGPWETIGELADYPATTNTDARGLQENQAFTLRLAQPLAVWGVRVLGQPAGGDNPAQAFSSCAGLQAFAP